MPILYQHQSDDAITWQKIAFDEEGGWWAGVRQCAATVALAAVLSATALSTAQAKQVYSYQQDDPAGNLKANPEEYYWQNPVAPASNSLYQSLPYLPDPDLIPAGKLFGQFDEDFWSNPTAPVPSIFIWTQQWTFDIQEPAGSFYGQPDEDFWLNPTLPIPASLQWPQQFNFDEQTPLLFGVPDEVFWASLVAPIPQSFYQPLPYGFDAPETIQFGIVAEDYWNAVLPSLVNGPRIQQWAFDDGIPQFTTPTPPVTGAHYIPVFRRRRR